MHSHPYRTATSYSLQVGEINNWYGILAWMYFHAPRSANWSVLDTHHLCICLLSLKSAFGSEPQHGGAGCSLCSTLCKVNHGGSATGSTEAIAFTTRSAQTNQVLLPPAPILTSKSKIADEDGVVVARPPCKWQIYAVRDINNLLTLTWCVCLDDYIHLFFLRYIVKRGQSKKKRQSMATGWTRW